MTYSEHEHEFTFAKKYWNFEMWSPMSGNDCEEFNVSRTLRKNVWLCSSSAVLKEVTVRLEQNVHRTNRNIDAPFSWKMETPFPASSYTTAMLCRNTVVTIRIIYCFNCGLFLAIVIVPMLHETETSSRCTQLWMPQSLCWQSSMLVSLPLHWTLSNQICPVPGP